MRSIEDEALDIAELQKTIRLMKQQQHGSRENMLFSQQQQQQQQQLASSAEVAAHNYRNAFHNKNDPAQLLLLLQVMFE